MDPVKGRFDLQHVGVRNHTGVGDRALRKAATKGALTRVRRGVYVRTELWAALRPLEQYRLAVVAAAESANGLVLSHRSAAALWGVPLVGRAPAVVDVLTSTDNGSRSEHGFARRATPAPGIEVIERGGLTLTTLPRTIVELALILPFPEAVVAADWALAQGCDRTELTDLVGRLAPGRRRARAEIVLAFADRRSGSPGESISRALIHEIGFPPPELQVPFHDIRGLIGIADFYWNDFALVGEFDGRVKYVDESMLRGRSPSDALMDEKRREDRIRSVGPRVARWVWDDLTRPRLGELLSAAGLPRHAGSK